MPISSDMDRPQAHSVVQACQWFNFSSVLFGYLCLLSYAYCWFFRDVTCAYNFHTFEGANCALWNYGIYIPWFPFVLLFFRYMAPSLKAGAQRNGGLYRHVARLYILHCVFIVGYTALFGMWALDAGVALVKWMDTTEYHMRLRILMGVGVLVLFVVLVVSVALVGGFALATMRRIGELGVRPYEDCANEDCEMVLVVRCEGEEEDIRAKRTLGGGVEMVMGQGELVLDSDCEHSKIGL